jgi:hypothetical protein
MFVSTWLTGDHEVQLQLQKMRIFWEVWSRRCVWWSITCISFTFLPPSPKSRKYKLRDRNKVETRSFCLFIAHLKAFVEKNKLSCKDVKGVINSEKVFLLFHFMCLLEWVTGFQVKHCFWICLWYLKRWLSSPSLSICLTRCLVVN